MYGANLSFDMLDRYLKFLVSNRFLRVDGQFYKISQKGTGYLKAFAEYQRAKKSEARAGTKVRLCLKLPSRTVRR